MTHAARPVPPALPELLRRWEEAGRPLQPGARWNLRAWQVALPVQSEHLAALPNPISRDEVRGACRRASDGPEEAVRGLVAAMVWGYGKVGYGPYRTARVLNENAGSAEVLAEVAGIARTEGGPAAFEWLSHHRLRGLGVAFATKYLFFCSAASEGPPALVLDRLVRGWLARHAGWSLSLDWRIADYRDYVEAVTAWAAEMNLDASELEYLVPRDGSTIEPAAWPSCGPRTWDKVSP